MESSVATTAISNSSATISTYLPSRGGFKGAWEPSPRPLVRGLPQNEIFGERNWTLWLSFCWFYVINYIFKHITDIFSGDRPPPSETPASPVDMLEPPLIHTRVSLFVLTDSNRLLDAANSTPADCVFCIREINFGSHSRISATALHEYCASLLVLFRKCSCMKTVRSGFSTAN